MNAQVFQGDCLDVMRDIPSESVHLAYLDPPFFTRKVHRLRPRGQEREFSFDDTWASHAEYAGFLYERLREVWRVLSPTGAVFFHCDRNASHIIRTLLDEVFGAGMFRAEIVWHYRRWSNAQRRPLPSHQLIYYYTKSEEYTFNPLYEEYSPTTNVDQILQRRRRDESGRTVYARDEAGEVIPSGGKKGVLIRDVWDIPYLNPKAKERVGYPTQKPLALLERIIKIASNEGDTVLDPFCGSGTALVAAVMLGRRAIGIDVSPDAVEITRARLKSPVRSESAVLKRGRESYRNADEQVLRLLSGLDFVPVQRNKGIDAVLKDGLHDKPVLVRVQRAEETLPEAVARLSKAAEGKNAAALFVIATHTGGYFDFAEQIPPNVNVIKSPALAVRETLTRLRNG